MPPLKLLLVDDHFVVRSGLTASLALEDDLSVVAEADNGEQALETYLTTQPDVVLMDLQLPTQSGIEATRQIITADPNARVLIFSTFARDEEIIRALRAGALGYLQKSASRPDLLKAIHDVAAGKQSLPSDLAKRINERLAGPEITPRELEILTLITQGRANKEIAAELSIAEDTVKQHVSRILQKLQVSDRAQATAEAIRLGIVTF